MNITDPDGPGSSATTAAATGTFTTTTAAISRVFSSSGVEPLQNPVEDVEAKNQLQLKT
ncbi:MAG: hypothetical protein PVI97_06120 [Candidatus Thiodiazotropha sp.]